MKNIYPLKVTWGDTDAAGIVFYPNFYRWMDQSTHELFGANGLKVSTLQKEKDIIFPLLETFCTFKAPLVHEDEIQVHSEVDEVQNKVFKVNHQFYKGKDIVAQGYEKRAWTSVAGEQPQAVEIPVDVKKMMEQRH
ncbi:acyl-CoA thioesterase [Salibacterium salarium]|uniref:Acyl-CoA thioesterase n=1 Tax=Salibacterium salarium TaxID=284579 RepID=A0A428N1K1_9BACI|nr:acyl-CoA thioesterase [Salibacterium salarium]RSL32335.1 acyl-CoA thioesterase [Salibacterium salarium]